MAHAQARESQVDWQEALLQLGAQTGLVIKRAVGSSHPVASLQLWRQRYNLRLAGLCLQQPSQSDQRAP